jgi:hypothetical protein
LDKTKYVMKLSSEDEPEVEVELIMQPKGNIPPKSGKSYPLAVSL